MTQLNLEERNTDRGFSLGIFTEFLAMLFACEKFPEQVYRDDEGDAHKLVQVQLEEGVLHYFRNVDEAGAVYTIGCMGLLVYPAEEWCDPRADVVYITFEHGVPVSYQKLQFIHDFGGVVFPIQKKESKQ